MDIETEIKPPQIRDKCGCLAKLEAHVKQEFGEDAYLELKRWMTLESEDEWRGLPPLFFRYREGKKWKTSHFGFSWCPFCGTRQ